MEVFKKVIGFDNYEISNLGRLKVNLKYRKYRSYQYKILHPSKDKDGYYRTVITSNKVKKMKNIHRLVAIAFIDNPENKPCVNHINGIKTDNRVENLEWCTVRENNNHAIKLGLKKPLKGINHNMVKLSECDVLNIKNEYCFGNLTQKQLAIKYDISQSQIHRIISGKHWK
jgi:hypothetical protein